MDTAGDRIVDTAGDHIFNRWFRPPSPLVTWRTCSALTIHNAVAEIYEAVLYAWLSFFFFFGGGEGVGDGRASSACARRDALVFLLD